MVAKEPASVSCYRCEGLPAKIIESGKLYLWFPQGHAFGKIREYLLQHSYEFELANRQSIVVKFDKLQISNLAAGLSELLTQGELKDIKALFMVGEKEPQLQDFADVNPLQEFITLSQSSWLVDMLSKSKITSHFQPIVSSQDTSSIFAHEVLMRGIDDFNNLISPGRILSTARDAGLLFQVDLIARQTAIREASRHGLQKPIFINFTPAAIYDPTFCLRSTVKAIDEAGIAHDRVVFEITESDQAQDINHLKHIIDFYRTAGFRIALDDLGSGYSSLNLLHQLRPDFIKLDMELIRDVDRDPYKAMIATKILEIAQSLDILTIAEGIESVEELHWVQSQGTDFVQGFLIAKPTSPPVLSTPLIERLSHTLT